MCATAKTKLSISRFLFSNNVLQLLHWAHGTMALMLYGFLVIFFLLLLCFWHTQPRILKDECEFFFVEWKCFHQEKTKRKTYRYKVCIRIGTRYTVSVCLKLPFIKKKKKRKNRIYGIMILVKEKLHKLSKKSEEYVQSNLFLNRIPICWKSWKTSFDESFFKLVFNFDSF